MMVVMMMSDDYHDNRNADLIHSDFYDDENSFICQERVRPGLFRLVLPNRYYRMYLNLISKLGWF
jgi:hypothetical protein